MVVKASGRTPSTVKYKECDQMWAITLKCHGLPRS